MKATSGLSPMLEKTASSLEPCGIHRILPRTRRSFRSKRQLYTTFWQHGAEDIELTTAWQALMHGITQSSTDAKAPFLNASAFLLDFLYPSGPIPFLRRSALFNNPLDRPPSSFARVTPRFYTSSASVSKPSRQEPEGESDLSRNLHGERRQSLGQARTHSQTAKIGVEPIQGLDGRREKYRNASQYDHNDALGDLISHGTSDDVEAVWYHYHELEQGLRDSTLVPTVLWLSETAPQSDAWRICQLFGTLEPSRWTGEVFLAAITAELELQNYAKAIELFLHGLRREDFEVHISEKALDNLIATALKLSTWTLLDQVWEHEAAITGRLDLSRIVPRLSRMASVHRLPERVLKLAERVSQNADLHEIPESFRNSWQPLLQILVRCALISCSSQRVLPLLRLTQDHTAYEEFIRRAAGRHIDQGDMMQLAIQVYAIYRDLPGSSPSHMVLHAIFSAYCRSSTTTSAMVGGAELIFGDWHRFHNGLSRRAFQKYLAFYASLGYKTKVHKLWEDYVTTYWHLDVLSGDDTFNSLLQVHAVLGEVDEVQRIFNDISAKFGYQHTRHHWNILINAHVKAQDYDGAIETFNQMFTTVGPDQYSFGTVMQMAASRGDLGFVVDLYRHLRSLRVPVNEPILAALVTAYCENDLAKEAEDVCLRAHRKGLSSVALWNGLLRHYALRQDLTNANRILINMTDKGIAYTEKTYRYLLLGLALCRQAHHALHLLAMNVKDNPSQVRPSHFHIVMGAFIKTRQFTPVLRVQKMMLEFGLPSTSDTLVPIAQALGQLSHDEFPPEGLEVSQALLDTLREFFRLYGQDSEENTGLTLATAEGRPSLGKASLQWDQGAWEFSRIIYLFVQMRDLTRVDDLIELYRKVCRDVGQEDVFPMPLVEALMEADFLGKDFGRVKSAWKAMFAAAKQEARAPGYDEELPHTRAVSPAYQYVLCRGLKTMLQLLHLENDAAAMHALVDEVRTAGFHLDSKNWNFYIQALVELKQHDEAFTICEKVLMPNWAGWATARAKARMKNELPLDLRRKGMSPRYLRPTATTFYYLARGYMDMERLSPFSPEAAATLQKIRSKNQQTVNAIKSMIRVFTQHEDDILGHNFRLGGDGDGEERESEFEHSGLDIDFGEADLREAPVVGGPSPTT